MNPTPAELRAAANEAAEVAHAWGAYRDALNGLAAQIESTHDPEDKPYRIAEWQGRVETARAGAMRSLGIGNL